MPDPAYEKLGAFYLGRLLDPTTGDPSAGDLLYDAKDLTTHAVCVGMTGSGKTGLCVGLLEEAAIDGIPVLAIDPKGDLGNLLLTFPALRAADFEPWVDPGAALRKGLDVPAHAERTAALWRDGLAQWGQDGARIERLRQAADFAIYTPGSTAGLPLTVLRSFAAPPPAIAGDAEAVAERIAAAASSLLLLLGRDADPVQSREHILLAQILDRAWQEGRDVGLGDLIRAIQAPPFDKVGFFDLETFFPARDRTAFAMALNNLLASPSFAPWMNGEPLEIPRLLWTEQGKPRVSILSIAHLDEAQRMFTVTAVLNELVAWMRTQSGTTSLRCVLYMDEVFGYFPPSANPPAKRPMLTLLKQARAYGVGCVLATQNPVDLDYKGLSNAGTWFLGRLQTERDKARVLDGLEGASVAAGTAFDRASLEATLAGLGSRVFLMNNVHDDAPVLFHTRWVMSYLAGPMTKEQIAVAMRDVAGAQPAVEARTSPVRAADVAASAEPPLVPEGHDGGAFVLRERLAPKERLIYRPALLGQARLHYVSARRGVDEWRQVALLAPLGEELGDPWEAAEVVAEPSPEREDRPDSRGTFAELPGAAARAAQYKTWRKRLVDTLYRTQTVTVWRCAALRENSVPGETERDFRARLAQRSREARDLAVEKLRGKYAPKLARMAERIQTAEHRVEREHEQARQQGWGSVLSIGSTVLGALFGRKTMSATNVRKATAAVRKAGRAAKERSDVRRAEEKAESLRDQLEALEAEFEQETEAVRAAHQPEALALDADEIRPRKADIDARPVLLVWQAWASGEGVERRLS